LKCSDFNQHKPVFGNQSSECLKQEQGNNILVGGVDVPSQLMELGLIDEYRFVVMPIIAGEGRRLMEGVSLPEKLQLKLVESKPFKSGCVALRYLKQ
jgi:dihydrofolate reductase